MRQSLRIDILFAVFAVIAVGCAYVCALNITECDSRVENYYNNTRPNCSYPLIYCNGQDSEFCDAVDLCDPLYNCNATNPDIFGNSTLSPVTLGTTTTPADSSVDVRARCRQGVTEKYKYPDNCNYYYYCVDGFLLVMQCPINYAFYEQNSTCSGRTADVPNCTRR